MSNGYGSDSIFDIQYSTPRLSSISCDPFGDELLGHYGHFWSLNERGIRGLSRAFSSLVGMFVTYQNNIHYFLKKSSGSFSLS